MLNVEWMAAPAAPTGLMRHTWIPLIVAFALVSGSILIFRLDVLGISNHVVPIVTTIRAQ